MTYAYISIFIGSVAMLYFSGKLIISGMMKVAKFLKMKEFVVAFFVMAFAASLPNLAVGIISAVNGIPELSFGDITGGNVVDMTLAVVLALLFSPKKEISAESKTTQASSFFTFAAAIIPMIMVLDGELSRADGIVLILFFLFYVAWLFSKKERFSKIYNHHNHVPLKYEIRIFFNNLLKLGAGIALLLLAANGIVKSASFFAGELGMSIAMTGILIVGLGNTLPEIYFAIVSARKGETGMILGDLMGSVIVPTAIVLGIVALINPIVIADFSPFAIARAFLVISAVFFFVFVRSDRKISWKEAVFLTLIYLGFLVSEITVNG
jgi:cation:H+ antiporter